MCKVWLRQRGSYCHSSLLKNVNNVCGLCCLKAFLYIRLALATVAHHGADAHQMSLPAPFGRDKNICSVWSNPEIVFAEFFRGWFRSAKVVLQFIMYEWFWKLDIFSLLQPPLAIPTGQTIDCRGLELLCWQSSVALLIQSAVFTHCLKSPFTL